MELKEQVLGNLEVENRKRLALQEEENAERKNALEEKRLETVKKMNAAGRVRDAPCKSTNRKWVRTKRQQSYSTAASM
jgi:hypothetical protein